MEPDIIENLSKEQVNAIHDKLEEFDHNYTRVDLSVGINLGIIEDGKVIAGVVSSVTSFKILYISTIFVDEAYRRKGIGKILMLELENRAKKQGVNLIRVDTFNWQAPKFYTSLGYEQVGYYQNSEDGYAEHFFIKRLNPDRAVKQRDIYYSKLAEVALYNEI